jgi:formamidopyrimidine-DNA glycosylase
MVGEEVRDTARHGKRLGLEVGSGWWLVHLGMTGRFVRSLSEVAAPAHARVGWGLDDGHTVWFCDARRFGALVPLVDREALSEGMGPDALAPMEGPILAACFRGRRGVKVALMDQACLAGLGNIHAVEALWRAGVAPDRPVDDVPMEAWAELARAIPVQLAAGIAEVPDVQDFTYVTDGGENPFAVYGREGEPCPRCGDAVVRAVHGGRSTFWCPRCQPSVPG